ncbi:TraB/GumN family protein [Alteribacter aurantiacus]|uniref:TraB/GumN family protein n=1 Tax=Alteribacter aurantiacus TaxID=254410 RepID=UPI0004175600|nr:TraB/GumN family protein [Alteribacter aurantiacus]
MKKTQFYIVLIALLTIIGCSEPTESENVSFFEDRQLESAVREALGQPEGELTEAELQDIRTLHAFERNIQSLDGIENLKSLEELIVFGNQIEDITPLLDLPNIENVDIENNPLNLSVGSESYSVVRQLINNDVFVFIDEERFALDMEPSRGVFYEVTNDNKTVYMLGSIHIGSEELYPLHEDIEEAFEQSSAAVFEIDFTQLSDERLQEIASEAGIFDDDQSLEDYVTEEEFDEIALLLSPYGLLRSDLRDMKPWYVQEILLSVVSMTAGYEPGLGIDMHFLERAAEDEKEIIGLETAEDQLDIQNIITLETQGEQLSHTLDQYDELGDELLDLMAMWRRGDQEALTELRYPDENEPEDYQDYIRALTDERDEAMADSIVRFLEDGEHNTYFVVVGAIHLLGENSITDRLEQEGYTVNTVLDPLEDEDGEEA